MNIPDIEVKSFKELCEDERLVYNECAPREMIDAVTRSLSLSSPPDTVTLLVVDEVLPCCRGQTSPDWRRLTVREKVIWLLGLTSRAWSTDSNEISPPTSSGVLSHRLLYKHRNCHQIRNCSRPYHILLLSLHIFF